MKKFLSILGLLLGIGTAYAAPTFIQDGQIVQSYKTQFLQSSTGSLINSFKGIFLPSSTGSLLNNFKGIFLASSTGSLRNGLFAFGQGLSRNGALVTLNSSISGSLIRFTTISGSTIYAKNGEANSGSLVVKGASMIENNLSVRGSMTGYTLNVSGLNNCVNLQTSVTGAVTCNTAAYLTTTLADDNTLIGSAGGIATATSIGLCTGAGKALTYDTAANSFGCNTIAGTAYAAGQGLTLNNAVLFTLNSTISGSLIRFITVSGSTIYTKNGEMNSGSLVVKGASMIENNLSVRGSMTGYTLNVSGLNNCTNLQTGITGAVTCNQAVYLATSSGSLAQNFKGIFLASSTGSLLNNFKGIFLASSTGSLLNNFKGIMLASSTGSLANSFKNIFLASSTGDLLQGIKTTYLASSTGSLRTGLFAFGQGLSRNAALVTLNSSISGSLVRFTTLSGSNVYAKNKLISSGSLVVANKVATSTLVNLTGTAANFMQFYMQNLSAGSGSSTDVILGNDRTSVNGTKDYVDLGINSSLNNDPLFTVAGQRDSYLFASDGNLAIGTASGTKVIQFFAGGTTTAKIVMTVSGSLVGIGKRNPHTKLEVVGTSSGAAITLMSGNSYDLGNMTFGGSKTPVVPLEVVGTMSGSNITITGRNNGNSINGPTIMSGSTTIRQLRTCHFLKTDFCPGATTCATGTGGGLQVPYDWNNYTLSGAYISADRAGVTGVTSVQIRNLTTAVNIFSSALSIGSTRTSSGQYVLTSSPTRLVTGDRLSVFVNAISTTVPQNLVSLVKFCP